MSIVIILIVAYVCGAICKSISKSRGMDGGFWWGFFLGIIGIIIVAVRPNDKATSSAAYTPPPTYAKTETDSTQIDQLSASAIENGWRCVACGKLNYIYEAKCSCGRSRWDTSEPQGANTQGIAKCPKCGAENKANSKFCRECGSKIRSPQSITIKCPKCGNENEVSSKFCNECGASLTRMEDYSL